MPILQVSAVIRNVNMAMIEIIIHNLFSLICLISIIFCIILVFVGSFTARFLLKLFAKGNIWVNIFLIKIYCVSTGVKSKLYNNKFS